jgi:hypothetical protein
MSTNGATVNGVPRALGKMFCPLINSNMLILILAYSFCFNFHTTYVVSVILIDDVCYITMFNIVEEQSEEASIEGLFPIE